MHVLWEVGAANVQTVQQHLQRELAYTTVQTMLNILHRKGKAKRTLKDRAYFYKPAVSRSQVVGQHMSDIVERLFWRLGGESGHESGGNKTSDAEKTGAAAKAAGRQPRRKEMRVGAQLVLTFLLNASWQIALIVAFAAACDWLLRGTAARYRHGLWVAALGMAFVLPLLGPARLIKTRSTAKPQSIESVSGPVFVTSTYSPELDSSEPPAIEKNALRFWRSHQRSGTF